MLFPQKCFSVGGTGLGGALQGWRGFVSAFREVSNQFADEITSLARTEAFSLHRFGFVSMENDQNCTHFIVSVNGCRANSIV